jgi:hypothetical protein
MDRDLGMRRKDFKLIIQCLDQVLMTMRGRSIGIQ